MHPSYGSSCSTSKHINRQHLAFVQGNRGSIRAKSRLGRTGRLEETSNKTAMANALGLSANDKELSLSSKMGSMAVGTKGALSAKLPIIAATNEAPIRHELKPRSTPPQVNHLYIIEMS